MSPDCLFRRAPGTGTSTATGTAKVRRAQLEAQVQVPVQDVALQEAVAARLQGLSQRCERAGSRVSAGRRLILLL